eukprot:scaffold3695_cov398-Prasinococcus_capsulatus_cf.AAC.2
MSISVDSGMGSVFDWPPIIVTTQVGTPASTAMKPMSSRALETLTSNRERKPCTNVIGTRGTRSQRRNKHTVHFQEVSARVHIWFIRTCVVGQSEFNKENRNCICHTGLHRLGVLIGVDH